MCTTATTSTTSTTTTATAAIDIIISMITFGITCVIRVSVYHVQPRIVISSILIAQASMCNKV